MFFFSPLKMVKEVKSTGVAVVGRDIATAEKFFNKSASRDRTAIAYAALLEAEKTGRRYQCHPS